MYPAPPVTSSFMALAVTGASGPPTYNTWSRQAAETMVVTAFLEPLQDPRDGRPSGRVWRAAAVKLEALLNSPVVASAPLFPSGRSAILWCSPLGRSGAEIGAFHERKTRGAGRM